MTWDDQSLEDLRRSTFAGQFIRGVLADLMIPVATVGWLLMAIGIGWRFGRWTAVAFMLLAVPATCFTPYLLDRFATRKRLTTRKDDQPRAEVAASTPRGTSDHNLPRNER